MNPEVNFLYCVNPACQKPQNSLEAVNCLSCQSKLLLKNRYLVCNILGKGGFGSTFSAIDTCNQEKQICVIKQLRPISDDVQTYEMAKQFFRREVQTLDKVGKHPQIPSLIDYFEEDYYYLVQEFIGGNNLQQEVVEKGPFSEESIKQFLSEILPILDYIHSKKVIHRDIKPANIIRREKDKQLVLIDFGAVKNDINSVMSRSNPNTNLTNFAIGTAGFAPPEQLSMRPVYASDVYALGVTCIYLLTGKFPKEIETDSKTAEFLWSKDLDLSHSLLKVLSSMLEVSVKHRYKSAKDVLIALESLPYADILAQSMLTSNSAQNSSLLKLNPKIPKSRNLKNQNTTPPTEIMRDPKRGLGILSTFKNNQSESSSKSARLSADNVLQLYEQGNKEFSGKNLYNLSLVKVSLEKIKFSGAKLIQSSFAQSNLSQADFEKASLIGVVFRNTILHKAQLTEADLQDADLTNADLSNANLRNANLKDANLCGANLHNAFVKKEQIKIAKTNWKTTMPSGKRGIW